MHDYFKHLAVRKLAGRISTHGCWCWLPGNHRKYCQLANDVLIEAGACSGQ